MKVIELQSITEIKPGDCIETNGSRPVKVFCNDFNNYVCKYHKGGGFPNALFNEYVAGCFLKIWHLPVPDFAFVRIKQEHVLQIAYPYHYFDKLCFGSKFYGEYPEVDKFFIENPAIKKDGFSGWESFLKIAMFDIWLCNEDRNYNNFNLLFNIKSNEFVPIDHVLCFNGNNMDKDPYLLSESDSILSTPLFNRFFFRPLQQNPNEVRIKLIEDFKRYINLCHEALDDIFVHIPLDWNPDRDYLNSRLTVFFTPEWIKSCVELFTTLFTLNIKTQ